jgi:hypothetical protein
MENPVAAIEAGPVYAKPAITQAMLPDIERRGVFAVNISSHLT